MTEEQKIPVADALGLLYRRLKRMRAKSLEPHRLESVVTVRQCIAIASGEITDAQLVALYGIKIT